MIPSSILCRLFSVLAIIAITTFSTGLYYEKDADKWKSNAWEIQDRVDKFAQECEQNGAKSNCSHKGWASTVASFQDAAKESDAVAFWWFVAGWLSVALAVSYIVLAWIATGNLIIVKRDSTDR